MTDYRGHRFGNYHLIDVLGTGGFAQVYRGEQVYLKTPAAVKVLDEPLLEEQIEQFRLEAGTIARLDHPHIVRLLDYGVEQAVPYLVMAYAPGGTLRARHPRGTPVPLAAVVRYVQQVAAALDYAHQHKIIHRDVKPENLLLGHQQEVLLSDFGIAVVAHRTHSMPTQNAVGTIAYMAPEQLRRRPHPASDQYALAVLVYEWLTGTLPFEGSAIEIAMQHLQVPPPPLSWPGSGLPALAERVVQRALEKDPHRRFATVREFAVALYEASAASPLVVGDPGAEQPPASPAQTDPRDLLPTVSPPVAASAPEASGTRDLSLAARETWKEERQVGEPAPGDLRGERPIEPDPRLPRRGRSPDAPHTPPHRFQRRKVRLSLLALLLIGALAAWGLLAQGAFPPAVRPQAGSTANHSRGTQPGSTPTDRAGGATPSSPSAPRTPAATASPSSGTPASTPTTPGATPPATPPRLSVSPHSLTFLLQIVNCALNNAPQTVTIQNTGGGTVSWQAAIQNPAYLSMDTSSGSLGPSGTSQIKVTATCGITVSQTDQIVFTSNGGTVTVSVTITLS